MNLGIGAPRKPKVRNDIRKEIAKEIDAKKPLPAVAKDFKDGSRIIKDYSTSHKYMFQKIIDQPGNICWAIVLRRLLEIFNGIEKGEQNFVELSDSTLTKHIHTARGEETRLRKIKAKEEDLAVTSLKKSFKFISKVGMEKLRQQGKEGNIFRLKAEFDMEMKANAEWIRNRLEICPVGVIIDASDMDFRESGMKIYNVKGEEEKAEDGEKEKEVEEQEEKEENVDGCEELHAIMLMGYGYSKEGKLFFLAENTWGENWGLGGYGRIAIEGTVPVFYPVEILE